MPRHDKVDNGDLREICSRVLNLIKPCEDERIRTLNFVKELVEKLNAELRRAGIEAEAEVQGSIAKDTWLAGEKDIDIFIMLPKTYTRDDLWRLLEASKKIIGEDYIEAYAEHPYIEARIGEYTIDFVPCFKIDKASEVISSVDRTPLHTKYVKEKLNDKIKDEVRLLKRFMKGIGTYGAEIKIGGFSGYLCEILTIHYGSFIKVLRAASRWRRRELIDPEGYYRGRRHKAMKIFDGDPLIVVDPVDERRNVASAVREDRLGEFIAAARLFLKEPSIRFFYPAEIKTPKPEEINKLMRERGSSIIILKFRAAKTVPDILWGQLYKSKKAIRNLIEQHNFKVIRDAAWSDEGETAILIYELESEKLPPIKRHLGPPIEKYEDCERFLKKYLNSDETISGPRIEDGRWVVEIRRRFQNARTLLRDRLRGGGRDLGVASLIAKSISEGLEILTDEEIINLYKSNRIFAEFFTEFLIGKPRWLIK